MRRYKPRPCAPPFLQPWETRLTLHRSVATTSLFLHQFQHGAGHADDPDADCRLRHRRELARMQGWQFFSLLFELCDLRWIDRAEVKVNRRDGMVRQAVFGKVFTTHRGIDH